MRLGTLFVVLATLSGCRCSPLNPQAVTLRVVNTTRGPIYMDNSSGRLGLTVQRDVGGTLFGFDDLSCSCRYCSNACDSNCSCPDAGASQLIRLAPGSSAERTWNGVVQVSGASSCRSEGCLEQQNAPLNEPFTLQLCYTAQKPNGVVWSDAGVGNGALTQASVTCTTRQFAPQDLSVEISPPQGSACTTSADCGDAGALCLEKACTTSCPAHNFPEVGSDWLLAIASPDNMGFFEMSARGDFNQYMGTGTLTAVSYQSNTLWLSFSKPGPIPGEVLTGRVQIKLPAGAQAPISVDGPVLAVLIDNGDAQQPSRAFVLRAVTSGELIFAADMAQNGSLLESADLSPFSISQGNVVLGCSQTGCGRMLFYAQRLVAGDAGVVDVEPGAQAKLAVGTQEWSFLNVSTGRIDGSQCSVSRLSPWVLWKVAAN